MNVHSKSLRVVEVIRVRNVDHRITNESGRRLRPATIRLRDFSSNFKINGGLRNYKNLTITGNRVRSTK